MALSLSAIPACRAPDLTLQVAVSESGAAAAWVRSGRRVLVIFLDEQPDPALVTPFLSDPELGQAIAIVYLSTSVPPDSVFVDAPIFVPRRGGLVASGGDATAAASILLPSLATGVSATWTADGVEGHASVSIHARGVDWKICSGSSDSADLPAADTGFDLLVSPCPTEEDPAEEDPAEDGSAEDACWAITETARAHGGMRLVVFPIHPGERVVYATTPEGTTRIDGSLPADVLRIEPRAASSGAADMGDGATGGPSGGAAAISDPGPAS